MLDRARIVDENLVRLLRDLAASGPVPAADPDGPVRSGSSLTRRRALALFEHQVGSRHLDLEARAMRGRGEGFYTIGSAGHEGNAVVGTLARADDPALLHYRSGAFFLARATQRPGETPLFDVLLSLAASAEDPGSGGRHKVFASRSLAVPPMTSTIASHLPRAVGTAFFHERAKRLGLPLRFPPDAIVVCSFGDASVNHSVAAGAFNAAANATHQSIPVPVLFVCEDNGIGISTATPSGWVERAFRDRPGFRYVAADGLDLPAAWQGAKRAVELCRRLRTPVFLHLRTARLLGHAGSDVETGYRTLAEVEAAEARDPLLASARLLVESGAAPAEALLDLYEETRERVRAASREAARREKLVSLAAIAAPLAPAAPEAVDAEARRPAAPEARARAFGGEANLPERSDKARHFALLHSLGLRDLLAKYDDAFVFGEDVARKGGVYYVTAGLLDAFGKGRVFNTILDETTILGLALGAGMLGYLPIPEIQYLAYLHNAEDQLRGEAASLAYFSAAKWTNPMVVRIASLGYQKGFGGHFHNDNSTAVLRDVPGIVIAVPSRPADAVGMMRTAAAAARVAGKIVAFLEPIALYMEKDLYEPGDGRWQERYPPPDVAVPLGRARVDGDGADLLVVTYGNGVRMSLRAARTLARDHGIGARVLDLRWLAPLDREAIADHARATGRVLCVDEGRRSGGVSEAIAALILDECGREVAFARVTGADVFIPLADAALLAMPREAEIVEAAVRLCGGGGS